MKMHNIQFFENRCTSKQLLNMSKNAIFFLEKQKL